jgi:hypothetical protein
MCILCYEGLDVLSGGLEAYPGTNKSFREFLKENPVYLNNKSQIFGQKPDLLTKKG